MSMLPIVIPGAGGAAAPPSVGYVVTAWDAKGYPTAVDWYGATIATDLFHGFSTSQGAFRLLESVIFKNTIATIDDRTFRNCAALTISDNTVSATTKIGSESFANCLSLGPKIKLKSPYIGYGYGRPFTGCTGIIKAWISDDAVTVLGASASQAPFYGAGNVTDIYIESASVPAGFGAYWYYIGASTYATVHLGVTEAAFDAL